jgi:hypothetical protein
MSPAMSLASRLWINAARLRRRRRRRSLPAVDWRERHRQWIREHAPGRSFADIGGLYELAGDVALLAEEASATEVTLFDSGDALLTEFPRKAEARGSRVRFVQGDLEDPVSVERIGPHDIVWCVGVIYHTPNPVRQLMLLREITGELLYLGTHTIPEIPGIEQACVYYPYLDDAARAAYAAAHKGSDPLWGIHTPFDERPMLGHGNFWWGITPSALRAMLRSARFEVVEERPQHLSPFYTEIVARPIDRDPILPPLDYFRQYGEARERDEEPPPFEDYYEKLRRERR